MATTTTTTTTLTTPTNTTTAPSATTAIPARGKVTGTAGDVVKFAVSNTNYLLHLRCPSYGGPLNLLVEGIVRVQARKAYTVPSGGNFISPVFGPPKTIQGRVRAVAGNAIVVQAGLPVHVQLPDEASAVELANGPIAVGSLVNVVALPGATFELVK
jgi:hypothetical protein